MQERINHATIVLKMKSYHDCSHSTNENILIIMEKEMDFGECTITITFGDVAENHVGMQKIGEKVEEGFTITEMKKFKQTLTKTGLQVDYYDLSSEVEFECNPASVIVVKNGISLFIEDSYSFFEEERDREWDTKAFMRGQVKNKLARYNLCYADFSQEPDFESGKGRVVNFTESDGLSAIREGLGVYLGKKARSLKAEGNKYYDVNKCGIQFHGDFERRIVVAFRLGETMPLRYAWFQRNQPISNPVTINIEHGDMYIMSSKAVGTDWKKSSIPTLRHAAGCEKYISMKIFEKRQEKRLQSQEHKAKVVEKIEASDVKTKISFKQKMDTIDDKIKQENDELAKSRPMLSIRELKQMAKDNKVPGYTLMNKGELIGILMTYGVV